MNAKRVVMAVTLCMFLCFLLGSVVDQAHAQGKAGKAGSVGGDKDLASKKGLSVLGSVKRDVPSATGLQKVIGVGSIFVMIAVLKWL